MTLLGPSCRRLRRAAGVLTTAAVVAGAAVIAASPSVAQEAEGESSPVEAGEAVGTEQVVVGDGHVDIGPRFVDGTWALLVRDDTVDPSVWRHLSDAVLQATDAAVVEVPDDPDFAFLGSPGSSVWLLPQVQQPGIVWPGWNTQDPEVATTIDREVTWTLTGVDGPGEFVLFVNQEFGAPGVVFDSRDPYPQETGIDANTHVHGNWVFTAPGTYLLDIEMAASTLDGEEVSAAGTLRVAVGDATDPQEAFAASEPAADPTPTTGPSDTGTDDAAAAPDGRGERAGKDAAGDGGSGAVPWIAAAALVVLLATPSVFVVAQVRARRRKLAAPSGGG
jgi:putative ABC transporter-associated repeat protein